MQITLYYTGTANCRLFIHQMESTPMGVIHELDNVQRRVIELMPYYKTYHYHSERLQNLSSLAYCCNCME